MGYLLADGLSFCRIGPRLVFLDLAGDRYFTLPPESARSFARLLADEPLSPEDRRNLAGLEGQKVLAAAPAGARPAPCDPPPEATHSLLEEECGAVGMLDVAGTLAMLGMVRLELRLQPLARALARLERRKSAAAGIPGSEDRIRAVAAAFRQVAFLASPLDRCLPRSIAAAHVLLRRGCAPTLVIGVSAQPFAAHCWVQCGPLLVTERLDEVRNFTPILTI